jgi:hypothetical protein
MMDQSFLWFVGFVLCAARKSPSDPRFVQNTFGRVQRGKSKGAGEKIAGAFALFSTLP